jgi:hypothetical protein
LRSQTGWPVPATRGDYGNEKLGGMLDTVIWLAQAPSAAAVGLIRSAAP